jgi:hypothetical protein
METQLTRRKCDSPTCDTKIVIDPANPDIEELARWVTIVFGMIQKPPAGGPSQVKPIIKHACRKTCAINILNLDESVPHEETPEDKVNLERLQAAANGSEIKKVAVIPSIRA